MPVEIPFISVECFLPTICDFSQQVWLVAEGALNRLVNGYLMANDINFSASNSFLFISACQC